jgi:hypothetical protein
MISIFFGWVKFDFMTQTLTVADGLITFDQTYPYSYDSINILAINCSLGDGCFLGFHHVRYVDLTRSNVTALPYKCFDANWALTEIHFPPGLTKFGASAFESCDIGPQIDWKEL